MTTERTEYPIDDRMNERLLRDFTYHPVDEDQAGRMQLIRDACMGLALMVCRFVPPGREQAMALTDLESVSMHANAGIARLEA